MFVYLLSFLQLQLPPVRSGEQELARKLARLQDRLKTELLQAEVSGL
jgi:hypothetical protein